MQYPLFSYRVEIPYSRQHFIQIISRILHLRVKIPLRKSSEHGKCCFTTFSLFWKSACWFFAPVTDFRASIPSIPWKSADFSHQHFRQSVSKNFMKNQQSRNKPTYPQQIRHYRTIIYINIHYFFARFSTELCSNDYAECEHGLRIVKPQDVMKRLGRRTVRHFCCVFFCTKAHWPLGWTPKRSMTTLSFDQLGADCGSSVPLYFLLIL